jgi:hypothetical protein
VVVYADDFVVFSRGICRSMVLSRLKMDLRAVEIWCGEPRPWQNAIDASF